MKAVKILLETCLSLKNKESCLILTDNTGDRKEIAKKVYAKASKICGNVRYCCMPEHEVDGQEPDKNIAQEMQTYDVVIILTAKSLSHTNARKQATAIGARIASMPGITIETLRRAVNVDYAKMQARTIRVANLLDRASGARVVTKLGTDISFSIKGRKAHGRKAGIFDRPGYWGNLPDGEAFLAPVEGTANGVYIVDSSQAGIGRVKEPIRVEVKNGRAATVSNAKLDSILRAVGAEAYCIAEFGIGTNDKAKICGLVLEDEKVLGTCHIALGNNSGFGGKNDVPVHVDGVMSKPTIYLDSKIIMQDGKLKI